MSHPRVGKKEYNTSSTNDLFQALPGEKRGNILKTLKLWALRLVCRVFILFVKPQLGDLVAVQESAAVSSFVFVQ